MRLQAMVMMAVAAGDSVGAAETASPPSTVAPVYLNGTESRSPIILQAKAMAGKMFTAAGVAIDWCRDSGSCMARPGVIVVTLADGAPSSISDGALAGALPFEGTHIRVYYERVKDGAGRTLPFLLAHVLVHEITHILQGCARHSDAGVMKARWSLNDFLAMRWSPLPFTRDDIDLIHAGLEKRAGRRTLPVRALLRYPED